MSIIASVSEYEGDRYSQLNSSDNYDVFATFNEVYELDNTGRNREFTIELPKVVCNINDYYNEANYSVCHQVDSFDPDQNSQKRSRLVLPPPILINTLNLHFEAETAVWRNNEGEIIIICDNNKSNKYKREIETITMIRNDALEKACETLKLKYFVFAERFIRETGYANACENHYQIEDGIVVKCIKNTGNDHYIEPCAICDNNLKDFQVDWESENEFDEFIKLINDNYLG